MSRNHHTVLLVAVAFGFAALAWAPGADAEAAVAAIRWQAVGIFALLATAVFTFALAVALRTGDEGLRRSAAMLIVGVAAFPAGTMLGWAGAGTYSPTIPAHVYASVVISWAALWVVVLLGGSTGTRLVGGLAVGTGYGVLLITLLDAVVDRSLAAEMLFGYDRAAGMRLYGLGNEMGALMVAGLVVGWAALADTGAVRPKTAWLALAASGASALLVGAVPAFGANIGLLAWGGIAVAVTVAGLAGRRVGWSSVLGAAGVLVLVAVVFAWVDSQAADPTHIGDAWLELTRGQWSVLGDRVAGRAASSWTILTYSPLILAPLAMGAALLKARLRPGRFAGPLLAAHPHLRAALDGVLWATPVALLVEDSGIVVPAALMLLTSCALLTAALEPLAASPLTSPPAEEAT